MLMTWWLPQASTYHLCNKHASYLSLFYTDAVGGVGGKTFIIFIIKIIKDCYYCTSKFLTCSLGGDTREEKETNEQHDKAWEI